MTLTYDEIRLLIADLVLTQREMQLRQMEAARVNSELAAEVERLKKLQEEPGHDT